MKKHNAAFSISLWFRIKFVKKPTISHFNSWLYTCLKKGSYSRKNFVFLFGELINLTVRVDTYFHPIRITYPFPPGPFFRAAPNWGKAAKHSLPQNFFQKGQMYLLSALFISCRITTPWGKPSNLWTSWVYSHRPRVLSWIWIRWIRSATHRNNFKSPLTLAMSTVTQNSAQTSSHFISWQHFLETFTLLSPNDQDHTFMDDNNVPVPNQQTRLLLHLWRPYLTHTFNHIYQPLRSGRIGHKVNF